MVIATRQDCTSLEAAQYLGIAQAALSEEQGRISVLVGDGGLGKTYAVRDFLASYDHAIAFKAQCRPDTEKSLYPLYEALADYLRVHHWQNPKIRRLFKEFLPRLPRLGPYIEPVLRDSNYFRGVEATIAPQHLDSASYPHCLSLFARVAEEHPYILWVDDAQWADTETLSLITYLADRLPNHFCHWVLCFNPKRVGISHRSNIDNLFDYLGKTARQKGEIVRLHLRPYQRQEMESIIRQILGKPLSAPTTELDALYERTRGVPYILYTFFEVLRSSLEDVGKFFELKTSVRELSLPTSLKEAVRRRLERLYSSLPEARPILELASVVGERFTEAPIDNLLNLCDSYNWLSKIETHSYLIRRLIEQRQWEFEHVTVRDYIYSTLGSERQELHLRFAEHLEAGDTQDWSQVAFHYKAAGAHEPYLRALLTRAREELHHGFFHEARAAFDELCKHTPLQLAGHLPAPLFDVLYEYSLTFFYTGDYEGCVARIEDLQSYAVAAEQKAELKLLHAKCLTKSNFQEDFLGATALLNSALEILDESKATDLLGRIFAELSVTLSHLNKFEDARYAYERAEAHLREAGNSIDLARLGRKACVFYEDELALPLLLHALELLEKNRVIHEALMVLVNISSLCLTTAPDQSEDALSRALEKSGQIDDYGLDYILNNRALLRAFAGDLKAAIVGLEEAARAARRDVCRLIIENNIGVCLVVSGRVKHGVSVLRRTLAKALNVGEDVYVTSARHNLAVGYALLCRWKESLLQLSQSRVDRLEFLNHRYREKKRDALASIFREIGATRQKSTTSDLPRELNLQLDFFHLIEMEFWGD